MCNESVKESPFRRQPQSVRITITGGEKVDREEMYHTLMRKLANESAQFDYDKGMDQIVIITRPMAVND